MDDIKEEFNKKRNTGENWIWNAGKKKKKHSESNLKKKKNPPRSH